MDMNMLSETFDLYFKKAKQSLDKGDKALAKKYYMLAAEQMLKMAKESKGELQKARYRRAKSLVEQAENIGAEKRRSRQRKKTDKSASARTIKYRSKKRLRVLMRSKDWAASNAKFPTG